jgi:hypothetical protein
MAEYNIGLFTGAGIGIPLGLPATNGFQKTITSIDSQLFHFVKLYLASHGGVENDIEKVLYLLEDFSKADDFTKHIIKTDRGSLPGAHQLIIELQAKAITATHNIKSDIYEILEKYDIKKASDLYFSIFAELKTHFSNSSISFFTTNYDLTFEAGFDENEVKFKTIDIDDINFGFQNPRFGKMIYSPSQEFNWEPNIIEYKKLHGSLDWIIDNKGNCVKAGVTTKPKDPGEMPLLYPGFKGIPSKQPFIDLHDCFYERLSQMNVLFVLGFAFRDQYLNNLFDFALKRNKDLRIVCYNPCEISDLPFDSMMKSFISKYPENFFHIKQPINVEEKPLKLEENLKKLSKTFVIETLSKLI